MNCEELLAALHDYVGGELVVEVRETFEVHLRGCEKCGVIVHSYTCTARVARVLPPRALSPAFEAKLRAALEQELADRKTDAG